MLSPEIARALQTLQHRSASVAAVMNTPSSDNRFTRALLALEKLAIQENIPIAIVGGLAAIRYGYPAVTEDISSKFSKRFRSKPKPRFVATLSRFTRITWLDLISSPRRRGKSGSKKTSGDSLSP